MPPKVQKEYFIPIKDIDHWNSLVVPESKKLSVIDLHLPWCGSCTLMQSTYRSIALKIDEWEDRLQFLVVDTEKLKDYSEKQASCMPKFLFFVGSKLVAEVAGLNVPRIMTLINKYLPSLEDD